MGRKRKREIRGDLGRKNGSGGLYGGNEGV